MLNVVDMLLLFAMWEVLLFLCLRWLQPFCVVTALDVVAFAL